MKFLSTRDLRNQPGYVRDLAAQKDDVVLTANGKPVAILVGVDGDDFEETARAIRQAKAHRALSRMRRPVSFQHQRSIDAGVNLRRTQAGMPQQLLQTPQIRP